MSQPYVEHANLTVRDLPDVTNLLLYALPDWRIRGEGRMLWFGKEIRWLHVGSDTSYLALQDGGEGAHPDWRGSTVGMKHVGFVVASLDDTLHRLAAAGYGVDHWGSEHPHRRSAYVLAREGLQFEFVEYLSEEASERNDYSL
jgi:catechol 2,3-dioxygenase-like lactoylglutathione lyase family enzyme